MLSVLIPVYNYDCSLLVTELHKQCLAAKIQYEIIVLDDVSERFKEENRKINQLSCCTYIESDIHYGRAKIRNELGNKAQFENLLFIDSDALVDCVDFIQQYVKYSSEASVVIGGMKYTTTPPETNRLRWFYGKDREEISAKMRNKNPYQSFISFNFLIKKETFALLSFDEESINEETPYGHEDTLLGITLENQNIPILHIDNGLIHNYSETNEGFINNSQLAVEKYVTIPRFRSPDVVKYIKIFRVFEKIEKYRCVFIVQFFYSLFHRFIYQNLLQKSPSLLLFDLYRLGYLADFYKKRRK